MTTGQTLSAGSTLRLPAPPTPAGSYEPVVLWRGIGFVSGQFPLRDGQLLYPGVVGGTVSDREGREAAELAALNVLAQIDRALGSLDRLESLLRVDGFVASAPGWANQPYVLDGASELFRRVLGPRGRHARSAMAVPALPLGAPVELVVTFAMAEPA